MPPAVALVMLTGLKTIVEDVLYVISNAEMAELKFQLVIHVLALDPGLEQIVQLVKDQVDIAKMEELSIKILAIAIV